MIVRQGGLTLHRRFYQGLGKRGIAKPIPHLIYRFMSAPRWITELAQRSGSARVICTISWSWCQICETASRAETAIDNCYKSSPRPSPRGSRLMRQECRKITFDSEGNRIISVRLIEAEENGRG